MTRNTTTLNSPYGGSLIDLIASTEEAEALRRRAGALPSIQISERSACDLELLATGIGGSADAAMGSGLGPRSGEKPVHMSGWT